MKLSRLVRHAALAVLLFPLIGTASAAGYFAIEGSSLSLDEQEDQGISPAGIRMRLGTPINRLMDVEGHYGFSFKETAANGDDMRTNYYGLYIKAYLPVGYNSAIFALAGMSTINLTQDVGSSELKDSRSGTSFGFGMETRLTANADLTADYVSYIRDEGIFEEVSSFNFGIKLYF